MIARRNFLAVMAGMLLAGRARAQAPGRPTRIIVGFPPGGSTDVVARLLAEQLTDYAPVVLVDNRPGAGGRIALELLKQADADGSVMALTPASMLVLYPHVFRRLAYEPLSDFAPVCTVSTFTFTYNVGPAVPPGVRTLVEFFAWCRQHPAAASYGSSGTGTVPHLLAERLARAAGAPMTHVPYKGGAQAIQEVAAGQIAANIGVTSTALPYIRAGRLRALATTGARRSAALPEVPTLQEAGFGDLQAEEWFGIFLPVRAPREAVLRLNAALRARLQQPALREALGKLGFEPGGEPQAEFAARLRAEHERWGAVVRDLAFAPGD
jgi:tripartite-type tricarboxylate transporter receptor subunit TctC